ncbi:hypothetical protein V6N11_074576 [Hibiscus sabdariffa]|uniref:Uncharacterized protein n=1 Tax=Hibiscus sabdariffa TaxID=183260 RepID=A0ABR2R4G6_9ROSI
MENWAATSHQLRGEDTGGAMVDSSIQIKISYIVTVGESGIGDCKKIQDAIDAAPSDNEELEFVLATGKQALHYHKWLQGKWHNVTF